MVCGTAAASQPLALRRATLSCANNCSTVRRSLRLIGVGAGNRASFATECTSGRDAWVRILFRLERWHEAPEKAVTVNSGVTPKLCPRNGTWQRELPFLDASMGDAA